MDAEESAMISRKVPRHVAVIMDGNGRWARLRGLSRAEGHRQGVKALKPIVKESLRLGISVLTVYAFSTENWQRPQQEVDALMNLLVEFLRSETVELKEEGVSIRTVGNVGELPDSARRSLDWAKTETAGETKMVLNIALNYGSRDEIVRAVNRWLEQAYTAGQRLTADVLERYLDTGNLPDPDLLIRTSGEIRVSNFLLWQIAYAEIFISDKLWPDFTPADLREAVRSYLSRERRFGRIG